MRAPFRLTLVAAVVLVAGAFPALSDPGTLNLSGRYSISEVDRDSDGVNLNFSADLVNQGADTVSGEVVLRDPDNADQVFARFGDVSIDPGESAHVSSYGVQVSTQVFDSWTASGAPAVYLYVENDEGDMKMYRVPMTKVVSE